MTSHGPTVVVVDGDCGTDGVDVTTGVVLVDGGRVPGVEVVDVAGTWVGWVAPWVMSAVMPTAAAATIRTIRTTIQPLTIGRFSEARCSSFMNPS
jgi:hypothetical protein